MERLIMTNDDIGWGKKWSYCIAFSVDGAEDVTRRYVRSQRYAAPRHRCSEPQLVYVLDEIRSMRQQELGGGGKIRVEGERLREQKELQMMFITGVVKDLCSLSLVEQPDGSVSIVGTTNKNTGTKTTKEWTPAASKSAPMQCYTDTNC
jgi:peptide-N4-(N-acetyl-beta-glucosaminyl)asparagine amidase